MEDREGPTVGVLSPYLAGYYFGTLISSVQRLVGARRGRLVAISTATLGADSQRGPAEEHLPRVAWSRVDGFVVITKAVPSDYLQALLQAGKPIVTLAYHEPNLACPAVLADNRGGVRRAVEHLLEHGHRQIGFAGCLEQFDVQERYASYRDTLLQHGIEPDPTWYFEADDSLEPGGQHAARRMIEAGLPCTAVVAGDDLNAIGIMTALKQTGHRVPSDLAVVGFDDMTGVDLLSPSLSSVSQRFEAMAALASELLLNLVEGHEVPTGPHVIGSAFVARESCGCAAASVAVSGAPQESPVEPIAELNQAMRRALAGTEATDERFPEAEVGRLGSTVERTFQRAAEREVTTLELLELNRACQDLCALGPAQLTSEAVLRFALRLSSKHSWHNAKARPRPTVLLRLNQCVAEVRVALSRAVFGGRTEAYYDLRQGIRDEHSISMDMLRGHEEDPRSLSWLSRTNAVAGVLALWRKRAPGDGRRADGRRAEDGRAEDGRADEDPELEVSGTFSTGASELVLRSRCYAVESFPPAEVLDTAGPDNLTLVFPVRNERKYWGLLLVVVALGSGFLTRETIFEWEALLCEALDYREIVRALRERSEQLALSYEREREMALAVKESEERYALAAQAANDGLWDWDLARGSVYYSARWKRMFGHNLDAVSDSPSEWLNRAHPDDRPGLLSALEELKKGQRASLAHEHRVQGADGSYRWVLCRGLAVPGGDGLTQRLVGSLTDTTERRLLEDRLLHKAQHDELTGLPNRALFLDRLSEAIARAKRKKRYNYAVLWLDLDGFKVLNDSLGHCFGDKLLVMVAERVRAHVRETDTAARFGGDEFALLLHGTDELCSLEGVARRLLDHLKEPYDIDGHRLVVTASVGIATSAGGYRHPENVLRDADIAMYKAKSAGNGNFAVFDSSMYAGAVARMKTETELRQAIELGHFELHYQPIMDLLTNQVTGLESLVRWRHQSTGLVPPLDFLPVAEESGLIVPLGHWVQREACRQAAAWQAASLLDPSVRVGVNLSNREFWDPRFIEQLDRVLTTSGVWPEALVVEITEGVIMDNLEQALSVLQRLRERKIQIYIDDFGTGHSSLQALYRLPIDALKIDKSFVSGLGSNKRATELVRTIIQMAKNLGLRVIAEGIETSAQARTLVRLKCPQGQGYLFSRPLPAPEISNLLASKLWARQRHPFPVARARGTSRTRPPGRPGEW